MPIAESERTARYAFPTNVVFYKHYWLADSEWNVITFVTINGLDVPNQYECEKLIEKVHVCDESLDIIVFNYFSSDLIDFLCNV